MDQETIRTFPLGDSALTVEFGTVISIDSNRRAISLADRLQQVKFPGFTEAVPAYASTTVFYDSIIVRNNFPEKRSALAAVKELVLEACAAHCEASEVEREAIEIPVIFDHDSGPDLDDVAGAHGLSAGEVIEIFTKPSYRVYMLGFLPGFTYMGEVDDRIATPRRQTPRSFVKKGSIGIAGKQTGIYSLDSPGGWQIVGRTNVEMFTPDAHKPTFLEPGDIVTFVAA